MNNNMSVEIFEYHFNKKSLKEIKKINKAKELWPLVYILSNKNSKKAYIGETTDVIKRLNNHFKDNKKKKLKIINLLVSDYFNKSAALNIESNLIKYFSAEGTYTLLNRNVGIANHNYYEKSKYEVIFPTIWENLKKEGLINKSLKDIENSDLFKYSPYKHLSKEQMKSIKDILESIIDEEFDNIIINGGAGTGKSIIAIYVFQLLYAKYSIEDYITFKDESAEILELVKKIKDKYNNKMYMALVIPMKSFRKTIKKIFQKINGLNANMVIGPSEVLKGNYNIIFVDEAHRLRRRVNIGQYYFKFSENCSKLGLDPEKADELDWIMKKSKKIILFYDSNQSVKPTDIRISKIKEIEKQSKIIKLKSQFRVNAGNDYVDFIDKLLNCNLSKEIEFNNYDFYLFDSIEQMVNKIKNMDLKYGLSRLVAGYSWKWVSRNNPNQFDIKIENIKLKWNSTKEDWINQNNSINEVGCIHTVQGYDLNYTGIIFGNEISYDKEENKIIIQKENYYDRNGFIGISDINELENYIINIYKTLMLRGIRGTYVYVCDKNLREYFSKYINIYKKTYHYECNQKFDKVAANITISYERK